MYRHYYYDKNGKPLNMIQWGELFQNPDYKIVKRDQIGDVKVYTVWLGMDHGFLNELPIIFETMVFGGEFDQYQERYATEQEALAGHKKIVGRVNAHNN